MTERELKRFNRGNKIKASLTYYEHMLSSFKETYGLDIPCKIIIYDLNDTNGSAITSGIDALLPNDDGDIEMINLRIIWMLQDIIGKLKKEFKRL